MRPNFIISHIRTKFGFYEKNDGFFRKNDGFRYEDKVHEDKVHEFLSEGFGVFVIKHS